MMTLSWHPLRVLLSIFKWYFWKHFIPMSLPMILHSDRLPSWQLSRRWQHYLIFSLDGREMCNSQPIYPVREAGDLPKWSQCVLKMSSQLMGILSLKKHGECNRSTGALRKGQWPPGLRAVNSTQLIQPTRQFLNTKQYENSIYFV